MKKIKYILGLFTISTLVFVGCQEDNYSLGDLTVPSNLVINADIVGKNASNPNGDGSGDVNITVTGDNAISYRIDFDNNTPVDLVPMKNGAVTKKYTALGINTYRITVVAYGKGGSSSNITKEITVRSDFNVSPTIVSDLTNGTSKTWVVNKDVAAHLRVGPWGDPDTIWWSAAINEKLVCCPCFYTATYTFTKLANGTFTLQVITDGSIFANASSTNLGLPGGAETCHSYTGNTKTFTFGPSLSGISATSSKQTNINISGIDGFIGYGSCSNTYEILDLNANYMYLRSQGVNTANAWYLKLKPVP